jgi:hypothetical protein
MNSLRSARLINHPAVPTSANLGISHCGERQEDRDPLPPETVPTGPLANAKLDQDEVRALLTVDKINSPTTYSGPALLQVLFIPHPAMKGPLWLVDVTLTLVALPLLLNGFLLLMMFGRRRIFGALTKSLRGNVELTAALFGTVLGTASILILGLVLPLPWVPVAGAGATALFLRAFARMAAEGS